jgi:hypothetical protein
VAYTRSPAEYFIRFLFSRQAAETEAEVEVNVIENVLDDHEIAYPGTRYLRRVKANLSPYPDPFIVTPSKKAKEQHLTTRQWMKRKGIHDLWYPTESVQEAYRILGEPRIRAMAEDLLLSPMRVEEVTTYINKHYKISLTPDGVQTFGHYFWNKTLLTDEEWMDLLSERKPSGAGRDVVRAAPDVANMVVPWLTGLSGPPPNITSGSVARRIRDVAFMKLLEIERRPAGEENSRTMSQYMKVVCAAEGEMRQSDVALKDVLSAFEKFRLNKDAQPVPSIEKVAKLNHSQSGAGTGEANGNRLLEDS